MNYVDFAIATSLFLFFFAAVIMFVTNYFSGYSSLTKTSELRPVTESVFSVLFKSKGVPENWDANYSITPVKVGLMEDLYMVPIIVKEDMGSNRINEPVTTGIAFDENCQNKSWNTTLRLYDEDDNEVNIEISDIVNCSNIRFLNESSITWEVNSSANQIKKYYLYYSPDENVTDPGYTPLAYNTSSWIPSDRDSWTETTTNWTRYEGSSGTVTNDTVNKIRGTRSVNITGNFSATALGLRYNPTENITGISNGWYIDAWVYINNKAQLGVINIRVNDNSESIFVNIKDDMEPGWSHFAKELSSTAGWSNWSIFDASNGINYIDFYAENNSADLTRTLKIDGLHFKRKPLTVKTFPEEKIDAISYSRFEVMKNLSYDELKRTIGNYKMSVQIDDETYGGRKKPSKMDGGGEFKEIMHIMKRQALHAASLGFEHPTLKKYMEFNAPLPQDMQELLNFLSRSKPVPS